MALKAAFIVPHPPLIVPSVGRGQEAQIHATIDAYDSVAAQIAELAPQTIVITSPHATAYADYFHISPGSGAQGDMQRFGAYDSTIECAYDTELADCIASIAAACGFPAGTDYERDPALDHATYIPLYFVNKYYADYKVVRIGLSGLSPLEHYRLGEMISDAIDETGRDVVFVASGDLSHRLTEDGPYGFAKEGPVFDEHITEVMASGDFIQLLEFDEAFCDKAAECGLRSFQIMAGALDGKSVDSKLLSYEGPFGVGYGVASFYVTGDDPERDFAERFSQDTQRKITRIQEKEDAYISLARESIDHFVRTGSPLPLPGGLPQDMTERKAGVFVSLHKHGRLRGCIGTIGPVTSSVAEEIIRNAVSSCSEDPRFSPVEESELDQLEISVDVLAEAEPISSKEELDPQRYGVIVTNGHRRGLLLPMLDGVDTVEDQIAIAKRKAGIADYEDCSLQRFEVVRHEVEDL